MFIPKMFMVHMPKLGRNSTIEAVDTMRKQQKEERAKIKKSLKGKKPSVFKNWGSFSARNSSDTTHQGERPGRTHQGRPTPRAPHRTPRAARPTPHAACPTRHHLGAHHLIPNYLSSLRPQGLGARRHPRVVGRDFLEQCHQRDRSQAAGGRALQVGRGGCTVLVTSVTSLTLHLIRYT